MKALISYLPTYPTTLARKMVLVVMIRRTKGIEVELGKMSHNLVKEDKDDKDDKEDKDDKDENI